MLGVDRFITKYQQLKNVPLGLLTNHATFAGSGYPVAYELLRSGFAIKKLFSPEHGIESQGEDGKKQANGRDPLTQLPVISLYGEKMTPETEDLEDIEIILVDLPNIGCRFYTYTWTLTHMLEACALANKKIILLDRPNLSKRTVDNTEGPLLDELTCSSFLGRWKMPLTFSYSLGQLMPWFVHERKINIELESIPFSRSLEAPFVPPSPSMNEQQAVWMYPCTGLFEALNINLGRGTSFPFRVIGAPWINSIELFEAVQGQSFKGVQVFPYSYQPMWSTYANQFCHGLYFQVTAPTHFQPVKMALWLMNHLSVRYTDQFVPATYPTAANPSGENHLDRLVGLPNSHRVFCSGSKVGEPSSNRLLDVTAWTRQVDSFLSLSELLIKNK